MPSMVLPMTLPMSAVGDPEVFHDFKVGQFPVNGTFESDSERNGWIEGADGNPVLYTFPTDEPAFVIDPATGQRLGYRALAGFTNSLLDNRDPTTGNWSTGGSPTIERVEGIDGVADSAFKITPSGTANYIDQDVAIPADTNPITLPFYARKGMSEDIRLEIRLGGSSETAVDVDTVAGTATNAEIVDKGDWYRVIPTVNGDGASTSVAFRLFPSRFDGTMPQTIDFPAVHVNSSIAGPPIETEGSPVSTAADDATEPLPASCQDGFVWVVHARTPSRRGRTTQRLGVVNDGTDDNRILIDWRDDGGDKIRVFMESGGVSFFNQIIADIGADMDFKAVVRAEGGRYAMSVNGGALTTSSDASFPGGLSNKRIGRGGLITAGTGPFGSTIYEEYVDSQPEDWSDADVQNASAL